MANQFWLATKAIPNGCVLKLPILPEIWKVGGGGGKASKQQGVGVAGTLAIHPSKHDCFSTFLAKHWNIFFKSSIEKVKHTNTHVPFFLFSGVSGSAFEKHGGLSIKRKLTGPTIR